MTADLLFSNVEFFGSPTGQRVRVRSGEAFRMELHDYPEGITWATTADPVLSLNEDVSTATIEANGVGTSEIQIQKDRAVLMYVTVEVFDPLEAMSLGIKAGTPEQK